MNNYKTVCLTNEQLPYWFDRDNFGNRNVGTFWVVKGEPFDETILEQAVLEAVKTSKILCYKISRFLPNMKLSPQIKQIPIQITRCDAQSLVERSRQTMIELLDQPGLFDKPPLIKCYAGLSDKTLWSFGFVCPHIMMDGLSTIKFARAIADSYAAIATQKSKRNHKTANTYLDFIAEQTSRPKDTGLESFWRDYMNKPCDMTVPSSVCTSHSTYLEQNIDNQAVLLIEQLSKQSKISLQAIYLHIFQQALYSCFDKEKIYISYIVNGIKHLRYAKTIGNFSRLNFIYIEQSKNSISERLNSINQQLRFLETKAEIPDIAKVYLYESKFWKNHTASNRLSFILENILRQTILSFPQYSMSHKYIAKFGSKALLDSLKFLKQESSISPTFISPTLVIMPQYKLPTRKKFNQGYVIFRSDLEPVNVKVSKNLMYLYLSRNLNAQYRIALNSHLNKSTSQALLEAFTQQMMSLTRKLR